MKLLLSILVIGGTLHGAGTTVQFQPSAPDIGPFPSDYLTVVDPAQLTGLRVNLPLPECAAQPSSCQELALINQLDGFSVTPRFAIRFSGPVDTNTLRNGIAVLWLDNAAAEAGRRPRGYTTRLNQLIYDPQTNAAFGESDEVLDQHRRYVLVVTDAVRDAAGDPVQPEAAFNACIQPAQDSYCTALSAALRSAPVPGRVMGASLFTTLSATTFLERARAATQTTALDFRRTGSRSIFRTIEILGLTLRLQVGANPTRFEDTTVPLPSVVLQNVGRVAFGSFRSPSFLDQRQIMPAQPTGSTVSAPANAPEIFFHAFLPSANRPAAGYPVVIFGHGLNDSRFGAPTLVAGSLAERGFATLAMNAVGHGSGPEGTLRILDITLRTTVLPAGGRSMDLNGDGSIDSREGCLILNPAPVGLRDCIRQTALDLAQLVRLIRSGVDLDGDGAPDLDPNRIYYAGQSLGSLYGTVFHAFEPQVRAAALNVGGGTVADIARLSPAFRFLARDYLGARTPALLNRDGDFDDNYVLRDQPVRVNQVTGALEVQDALERLEWLQTPGDPLAFAPHIREAPLAGTAPRPALWQFARGDRTVPNPANSDLIRAAGMRESSVLYRYDMAREVFSTLPDNPHAFLVDIRSPAGLAAALAAQAQIAGFLASDGATIPDVNDRVRPLFFRDLFVTAPPLPEDLGFTSTASAVTSVSAATFAGPALSPDSIASAFGTDLATETRGAVTVPLPTSLAGTTVRIVDSTGASRMAPLFFVSSGQINYLVPADTALGAAEVTVTNGDGVVSTGLAQIERTAPGIFTASQDGTGAPAGYFVRVSADGSQSTQNAFSCSPLTGACVTDPVDVSPASDQVVLVLFGTGIRGSTVATAAIGGEAAEVLYAGAQSQFAGLDQVNLRLPRTLAGRGAVPVVVSLDGRSSNAVTIAVR